MKINWLYLIGFILGAEVIGNIGSLATFSQINSWYLTLAKPAFNPPSWLFGPVWTILFALMGISAYLVWQSASQPEKIKTALIVFGIQLALNVLWSFIFFGWHQPDWAFFEIILMWLAIVATIVVFFPISKTSAWLLVPYLFWVTFASILNFAIWRLN